jgi:MFS superfamily sulfate permease-like transporter
MGGGWFADAIETVRPRRQGRLEGDLGEISMSYNAAGVLPAPPPPAPRRRVPSALEPFIPKSIVCLREGYGRQFLLNDLIGGLTVGIIALPLSMALAIASGVGPERGLYTAIVAGFLISALGGSRVLVGGPTGAFVIIVAGIVMKHGYDGLAIATLMAGGILIIMGLARFGGMIKFIPYPVTTGFTSGIAVLIFSTQIPDFFGLKFSHAVPADFVPKWIAYARASGTFNPYTLTIAGIGLATILALRRFAPRIPGALVAVVLTSAPVAAFSWDAHHGVTTIGSRFGGIPRTLPRPSLPVSLHNVEVYEINGPFFFGVADRLKDTLRGLERPPKVFILRMRRVPAIDASGIHALEEFLLKCRRQNTRLLLAGVHAQPMFALAKYGLNDRIGDDNLFENIDDALGAARRIVGAGPAPKPLTATPEVAREAQRRG